VAQRDQTVDVHGGSDEDASTESEYNDSDIEGTIHSLA
jgi:hypothetical protein